jgi:hypothetical protein
MPDGKLMPYPRGHWNNFKLGDIGINQFLGINSVVSHSQDQHWVVDPEGIAGKPTKGEGQACVN